MDALFLSSLSPQLLLVFVSCVLVAGWDWLARRVPNNLLMVLAMLQCALLATDRANVGWQAALTGLALGFCCLLPFYLARVMGAGDVKYAAVIGLMCGPKVLALAWIVAGLLAGLHVLWGLSVMGSPLWVRANDRWSKAWLGRDLTRRREGRSGVPYAAYLSVGVLFWQFAHRGL